MERVRLTRKFWRGIGITALGLWLIVTVINLFYLDPSKLPQSSLDIITLSRFIGASGITILGLIAVVVFPDQFYIYAGIFCFWGLATLIDGGSILSLLMYALGLSFAYKQGFFKRFRRVKTLVSIVLGIGGISLQYRYGIAAVINTVLNCVGFCMVAGIGCMMFLPELHGNIEPEVQEPSKTPAVLFSEDDRILLVHILKGEKYESIAAELNLSIPTVKRRAKLLFHRLSVSNRGEFMDRYNAGLPDSI